MGQRRKGGKPVSKQVVGWSQDHPVAGGVWPESKWFDAWIGQMTTRYPRLARATKQSADRVQKIDAASTVTRVEPEALATAGWITPGSLLASTSDPERVVG